MWYGIISTARESPSEKKSDEVRKEYENLDDVTDGRILKDGRRE